MMMPDPPNLRREHRCYGYHQGVLRARYRRRGCAEHHLLVCRPAGSLIQTIPGPVIGGISFLLYGMIGTSGLRILVDNHVDYSKNRNMILTSVIFVTGLSGVTLALGDVSLSGMTLAAIVGMIMSLCSMRSISSICRMMRK